MPFILESTVTHTFLKRVNATPTQVAYQLPDGKNAKTVTFREFYQECRVLSFGLMGLGVKPGDRVAILASTRYEWPLFDMAVLGARAITVPIYPSNTIEDVAHLLTDSQSSIAIVEDAVQLDKIIQKRKQDPRSLPHLKKVVLIDPAAIRMAAHFPDALTLSALQLLGRREEAKDPSLFDQNLTAADPNDLLTICYTSGTTGTPKGAMITHDNMMSVLEDAVKLLSNHIRPDQEVTVSFLPLSHILGKVESLAIHTFGWRQVFAESLDKLPEALIQARPTILFAVPRVFEKAFAKIKTTVEAEPEFRKGLFRRAIAAGKAYYTAVWEGHSASLRQKLEYQLAAALVLKEVGKRFGGRLQFVVCGGAPLPQEIGEFFKIVGITILEGYGLTETCAPVAINTPEDTRFGSVGKPMPEVTIKIAEDGEVLVKSRKVFKGYFNMPEETAQVLHDSWFCTGDIGLIDDDGYLKITDRKKDLIITSGGKNIAPQKIENLAKSQKIIHQLVVLGDRRHFLSALVTLDREQVIRYANEQQIFFSEYAELIKNAKILALAQSAINEVNGHLAHFESIKKFLILDHDFTVEGGELTPSLKVRRRLVQERYKAELDALYDS